MGCRVETIHKACSLQRHLRSGQDLWRRVDVDGVTSKRRGHQAGTQGHQLEPRRNGDKVYQESQSRDQEVGDLLVVSCVDSLLYGTPNFQIPIGINFPCFLWVSVQSQCI